MTAIANAITYIRHFSLKRWFREKMTDVAVNIVYWAMSKFAVQRALVDSVNCGSPIAQALRELIDDNDIDIDADDVHGFDTRVEGCIDDYLKHEPIKVDVNDIEDFDRSVTNAIDEYISELVKDVDPHLATLVAQRLSY